MSLILSKESIQGFSEHVFDIATAKLESLLILFCKEIVAESGMSPDDIFSKWNKISPDFQVSLKAAEDREHKIKLQEEKKHKPKDTENKGSATCQYKYGPLATKANQLCGENCKTDEPAADGKTYCSRHLKQLTSKHTCCFVYGQKSNKAGEECGSRVAKKSEAFDLEGLYEGKVYKGSWMCKKHTDQVSKALSKHKDASVKKKSAKSKKSKKENESKTKKDIKKGKVSPAAPKKKSPAKNESESDEETDEDFEADSGSDDSQSDDE